MENLQLGDTHPAQVLFQPGLTLDFGAVLIRRWYSAITIPEHTDKIGPAAIDFTKVDWNYLPLLSLLV